LQAPARRLAIAAAALAIAAATAVAIAAFAFGASGRAPSKATEVALRTVGGPAGRMVVTGSGQTVYVYLPDPTDPPATTCIGDCANDWPPVLLTTPLPVLDGVNRALVGVVERPDGRRQLTLAGYPLYRFAGDHRRGDVRGESVGDTWFAVDPGGGLLALPPATFTPAGGQSDQPLEVLSIRGHKIVAASNGQSVYAYKDDTPTRSACTAAWCVQDWPPLTVRSSPKPVPGITATLGVLRRPDGTLQLTLAGHPLYRFSGDEVPGDLRGQGIGDDWNPLQPDGTLPLPT
jgi:predicted lipoprotein with Yx(FWY)xxD motif